jgi:pre-rRNA-processing protein TSR1
LIQLATPTVAPEMVREEDLEPELRGKRRTVPAGTSSYQAVWLDALSDDGEDSGSEDEQERDGMIQERVDERADQEMAHSTPTSAVASTSSRAGKAECADEMEEAGEHSDEDEEVVSWRQREDEERDFPDEVDTPEDVPAQVRFANYHPVQPGQSWDPYQELPLEYARMFRFSNWERATKRAVHEAKTVYRLTTGGMDEGGDEPGASTEHATSASDWTGQYVALVLGGVPASVGAAINQCWASGVPVVLGGLLRHERCVSVVHIVLRRHPQYEEPIPAKTAMDLHCGFRRLANARPIFSEYSLRAPSARYERFLHATGGRVTVATLYAPVAFDGTPVIALTCASAERPDAPRELIGTGHVLSADPERVVLKRILLTGLPVRIGRTTVRVKGMFYRPDDVQFYKSVKLRTKLNLTGHITESVGTHGEMKCVFSSAMQSHDTVLLPLYKRIYPCWPPALPESVEEQVFGGEDLTSPALLRSAPVPVAPAGSSS